MCAPLSLDLPSPQRLWWCFLCQARPRSFEQNFSSRDFRLATEEELCQPVLVLCRPATKISTVLGLGGMQRAATASDMKLFSEVPFLHSWHVRVQLRPSGNLSCQRPCMRSEQQDRNEPYCVYATPVLAGAAFPDCQNALSESKFTVA